MGRIPRIGTSMHVYQGALTKSEFDQAVEIVQTTQRKGSRPIKPQTILIAEKVLVDNQSCQDVADEYGLSYQRVRDICLKFFSISEKRNWISLDVKVPQEWKSNIEALVQAEVERLLSEKKRHIEGAKK